MAVEVFCVETFWRRGRKLERGQLFQYGDAQTAKAAGQLEAIRRPGVLVYAVKGDPVADIWQKPRVLARFGDAPTYS